jgi:Ca2+/Na+ antiporter
METEILLSRLVVIVLVAFLIFLAYSVVKAKDKNDETVSSLLASSQNELETRLHFISEMTGKPVSDPIKQRAFERSLNFLTLHINDPRMHIAFLRYVRSVFLLPQAKKSCYSAVFSVLSAHSQNLEPPTKKFFVDIARWSYAGSRTDGILTTYDEQAIQNDLTTLSKS